MRREHAQLEQFAFRHPLRVRWSEVDRQGIVFNPHYFTYADIAWTEYLRAVGCPYPEGLLALGSDLFAVHAEADYIGSAEYDDELTLAARVPYIGQSSMRTLTAIFRGEQLLTEVRMTYVNAALEGREARPLPPQLVDAILGFERIAPERKQAPQ